LNMNEAGTDEAGRGCLAGPVTAAAVILPEKFCHHRLNDSKLLSAKRREEMRDLVEREAAHFAICHVDPMEIDRVNILNASHLAMHRALDALGQRPGLILVDGNRFKPYPDIAHLCVVKGDGIYMSIAAASILAKTHRDAYMQTIHREYPMYHWDRNKGYPTKEHREALKKYGPSPYHRKSFRLLPNQLSMDI